MKQINILLIITFFIVSTIACAQPAESKSITMEQFKEKLKNDTSFIVLVVRTPEEVAAGMIDKAINIPIQVLKVRIDELEP